jgi:CRP/FNR family transcriptional regulator, cyclic AMP receptor protein
MLQRFEGKRGRRLRVDTLCAQKIVGGNVELAEELADRTTLRALDKGDTLIEQGATDNELFFVISGVLDVLVNGRRVAKRGQTDHVGEMAAVQPAQTRSASVIAAEPAVVAQLAEPDFADIANRHPQLYRYIAQELARRLLQRNTLINSYREKIRVFIISSAEALPIARHIQNAFQHDPFLTVIWTDGVFRATGYTLESLEAELDNSDFAIAVAHVDDATVSRGNNWPSPRDNVIFELGLFMGRLGRARAILMEPREDKVKLPSDLSGITTITYRFELGTDAAALLAPACNRLRDHILMLGPNNG